jgi:hypothetical protein
MAWAVLGWAIVLAACGGDDGTGNDTGADAGTVDSTAASADGTSSSTTGGSTSMSGSAEGSAATGNDVSGFDGSGFDGPGSDGGSGDTGTAACGTAGCGPDMVCVHPCCGGAPPACTAAGKDGACPSGSMLVDPGQCAFGCDAVACCQPTGPCEAPDPYCVAAGELVCGGDPRVADQCSVDDCYGTLDGDDLHCVCA